jgi:hypothetical protein
VSAAVQRGKKRKPSVDLVTKLEIESLVEKFNAGLKLLSINQEKLGRNFNQNLSAIQGAFHFVDAHQYVSRRIMNDMALGRLQMILDAAEKPELIDYEWYYQQYQWTRYAILFVEWLKKFTGHADADEEDEKEDEKPAPDIKGDDFTFGGDYASQNNP